LHLNQSTTKFRHHINGSKRIVLRIVLSRGGSRIDPFLVAKPSVARRDRKIEERFKAMLARLRSIIWLRLVSVFLLMLGLFAPSTGNIAAYGGPQGGFCEYRDFLCVDTVLHVDAQGNYVGHDEPSTLFYSSTAGSGNNDQYTLVLPKDPPTLPNQQGTGGTFNFQLHPAFWVGMAMCDTQSFPEYTTSCTPDSDANIFDSAVPSSPAWIGHHPGAAFMEMQLYPPGWVQWTSLNSGNSCDPVKWCAALNIDSLGQDGLTGQENNAACLNTVGLETVNFAFITLDGVAQGPSNPVDATSATYTPDPTKALFMNSGDALTIKLFDTALGFKVQILDKTTGQSGSMTASTANGFGQVVFNPTATTCTSTPYAFHPMYSTSTEHTRVPWTAHTYNVAFSDEVGHFEYCNAVGPNIGGLPGNCTQGGANDGGNLDADDTYCYAPPTLPIGTGLKTGGCFGIPTTSTAAPFDNDFDGVPYGLNWPGTLASGDQVIHSTPLMFTSPVFNGNQKYSQVAFEADLPGLEGFSSPACNVATGANCVNPPPGATFYPFYSTRLNNGQCFWQEGGALLPGTTNDFGGSSTAEFGPLESVMYQSRTVSIHIFEDFRQVLPNNPC
jgi:hypothetical protein